MPLLLAMMLEQTVHLRFTQRLVNALDTLIWRKDFEQGEAASAFGLFAGGLIYLRPADTFSSTRTYQPLIALFDALGVPRPYDEVALGAYMCALGAFVALNLFRVLFQYAPTPMFDRLRLGGVFLALISWVFLTIMFGLGNSVGIGFILTFIPAALTLITFLRLSVILLR
jgi:hypothetical protein